MMQFWAHFCRKKHLAFEQMFLSMLMVKKFDDLTLSVVFFVTLQEGSFIIADNA